MKKSELTIVLQGPISEITNEAITSARKFFPESKIIVSTWEGSQLLNVDVDLIIYSKDPGGTICSFDNKILDNTNRQIVSSFNGLINVKTKYAIKTRTDIVFTSDNCLSFFNQYKSYDNKYKLLSDRVIVVSDGTVNSYNLYNMPFHICDWFYLGTKDDLINIFDIDFKLLDDIKYYDKDKLPQNAVYRNFTYRFAPESYIWSSFIKKYKINFVFNNMYDVTNLELSNRILVNNLQCVELNKLGIKWHKYKINCIKKCILYNNMLNEIDWLILYKKFANGKNKIPFNLYYFICKILNTCYRFYKSIIK